MVKHFIIFDVDEHLNIYMFSMEGDKEMSEYKLNRFNIVYLAEEINPGLLEFRKS